MPTNIKEFGLEELIVNSLVHDNGYEQGRNEGFNRDYAINEPALSAFSQIPKKLKELLLLTLYVKYVILYERYKVR